jgi:alpha-amylase
MPGVSFVFHIHEPRRLKRFSFFDIGVSSDFFDDVRTGAELAAASHQQYRHWFSVLEQLRSSHREAFLYSLSLSGTTLELMREYAPVCVESIREATQSGFAELLSTPYYNSLVSLTPNRHELLEQIRLHTGMLQHSFGVTPTLFRNTELVCDDALVSDLTKHGFQGVYAEGVGDGECVDSPIGMFKRAHDGFAVLGCNRTLSRALLRALVECDPGSESRCARQLVDECIRSAGYGSPLVIEVPLSALSRDSVQGRVERGVFELFVAELLSNSEWRCVPLSEAAQSCSSVINFPYLRDPMQDRGTDRLERVLGNSMQRKAFDELYAEHSRGAIAQETWRRLQDATYLSMMNTVSARSFDAALDRHGFESPYEVFITFMNIVKGAAAVGISRRDAHGAAW